MHFLTLENLRLKKKLLGGPCYGLAVRFSTWLSLGLGAVHSAGRQYTKKQAEALNYLT